MCSERDLSFLLQRGAAEYGSRIALRLSGTTAAVDFRFEFQTATTQIAIASLRAKRSNPRLGIARSKMDCFASLAMTLVSFLRKQEPITTALCWSRSRPPSC